MHAIIAKYWNQRRIYRDALQSIAVIEDKEVQVCVRKALTSHVRRQFRGISKELTNYLGCRFSCLEGGDEQSIHIEHAVPLNLIHNRILGICTNGEVDPNTCNMFETPESIKAFATNFIIGVKVTPDQHSRLPSRTMNGQWTWLADTPRWGWEDIDYAEWNYKARPEWLRKIMVRYEETGIPYQLLPTDPGQFKV